MTNDLIVPEQVVSYSGPSESQRTINYNPIFPVLTCEVELDLPLDLINTGALQLAGNQKNYEGGFTTYYNRPDVDKISHMNGLRQAIYSVAVHYADEADYELNKDKCSVDLWVNVMKQGGYQPQHNHPRSTFSGVFYSLVSEKTSPLVFLNPTNLLRMHDPQPKQNQQTPFTAGNYMLQPKQGFLYLWPSWLEHFVPEMETDQDRISFSFNIDFLPLGV